jgi:hypothetical protein
MLAFTHCRFAPPVRGQVSRLSSGAGLFEHVAHGRDVDAQACEQP